MRVFICSPYRGDAVTRERNVRFAQAACKLAAERGHSPYAPHLYLPGVLDDNIPEERTQGINIGLEFLSLCDELWVFGPITNGMKKEIQAANSQRRIDYDNVSSYGYCAAKSMPIKFMEELNYDDF